MVFKPCPPSCQLPPVPLAFPSLWKHLSLMKSFLSVLWDHSQEASPRPKARRVSLLFSLKKKNTLNSQDLYLIA